MTTSAVEFLKTLPDNLSISNLATTGASNLYTLMRSGVAYLSTMMTKITLQQPIQGLPIQMVVS